jgi:hypothetical protein
MKKYQKKVAAQQAKLVGAEESKGETKKQTNVGEQCLFCDKKYSDYDRYQSSHFVAFILTPR